MHPLQVFCAGIFNGGGVDASPVSHRARIPAMHAISAPGIPGPAALNIRTATYYRRSYIDPGEPGSCTTTSTVSCTNAPGRVWVEQRWYAHRSLPSLLVMEVQILLNDSDNGLDSYAPTMRDDAPFAMLKLLNIDGGPSSDINFTAVPLAPDLPYGVKLGATAIPESINATTFRVAVLATTIPQNGMVMFDAYSQTRAFLAVVRTSIETADEALVRAVEADFAAATDLAAQGTLWSTHVAEWAATIWGAGYESDRTDVARAVNTSLYAIVSSMRADRPFSTSPGGLAQDCYQGHSFWDCETWMGPGMLLTHPDIAQSMVSR